MSREFKDRVQDTTQTVGTGPFTLDAAVIAGFQLFGAAHAIGATLEYFASLGSDWEVGVGTLTDATHLARTTVLASSNGGQLVSFSAGSKVIFETVSGSSVAEMGKNASARVYYLSKCGAVDDADVSMASVTFGTDSTAAIQSVLNLASTTNPIKVIVDGRFSATGLRVKGNTWIDALPGCGMVLRTGSNKTLLENYNPSFDPAVRTDKNIKITGGIWNGNRNGANVNNNKGTGTTGLTCVMRFYGVENLELAPDALINAPSYTAHVMNCKRYTASRINVDVGPNQITNNDGLNTSGYCEEVVIRDMIMNTGDDPISVSPDDVWRWAPGFVYPYYPASCMGPIKNVLIDNIVLNSHNFGIRLMSGVNRLDNVTIRNLIGTTIQWALLFDNRQAENDIPGATGNGNIGSVTVDGMDVAVTSGAAVVRIRSSAEKIVIRNLRRNIGTTAIPTILIDGTGVTIQSLVIDGYDSYDPSGTQVVPHISMVGGVIKELKISNVMVRRGAAANASALLQLTGGAVIESLQLNNISLDGIANLLVNTAGTITRIQASNIIHLNPTAGAATFSTASSVGRLGLSGYIGTTATSGTFTTTSGDGLAAVVDTTAPTISSAVVSDGTPTKIRITLSESLDAGFPLTLAMIAVSGHTPSALTAIGGGVYDVTVDSFVFGEAARTLTITVPGTNGPRDAAGNLMATQSKAVTNSLQGTSSILSGATYVTLAGDAVLTDSGTVKSLTAGGQNSVYHRYGGTVPTLKLAIGTDGWVGMRYQDTAQYDSQVGFNVDSTVNGGTKPSIGFTFSAAHVVPITSGAGPNGGGTAPAPVVGNWYILRWVGNTATLETSADGATWTVLNTFTGFTRAADMYVHGALYNTSTIPYLQGVGLS